MSHLRVDMFSSFQDAEAAWRRYEQQEDPYVYQTFDWAKHWYETIGRQRGVAPCLTAVADGDGEPLAFLPLGVERRLFGSALVWLGGDIADYHAPILTPAGAAKLDGRHLGELFKTIRRRHPRLAYADFHRQPAVIGDLPNPFFELGRIARSESALSTRISGDWPSYYTNKRSKKTRHNDRRKRRKLEAMGKLDVVIADTPEEIDLQVEAMLAQKEGYVARLGETNGLTQPGHDDFLKRLAGDSALPWRTLLCALKLDDQILAVQWGVLHRRRFFSIVASYDDGPLSRYSTGEILLRELFVWCFDNDVEIVDFTCGNEPYKLSWCDRTLDLEDRLLPLTMMGRAAVGGKLLMRMLKRQVRATRPLRWLVVAFRSGMHRSPLRREPPSRPLAGQQTGPASG